MKSVILAISIALTLSNAHAEQPFTVFTVDKGLQAKGAEPYTLLTHHYWFDRPDGKYDFSKHSPERTRKFLPSKAKQAQGPLVIDIECWKLTPETRDDVYHEMLSVANTVRQIAPEKRIGWYAYLPIRDYWTPTHFKPTDPEYQSWTTTNRDNIATFGHLFDFVAPSLYTFYKTDTIDSWSQYAHANIEQGVGANKQIYAFVMPKYHQTLKPIPDELWRQQLRFLRDHKHCNGVFIFAHKIKHDWQTAVAEELLKPQSNAK